jgi:hypothetical protein
MPECGRAPGRPGHRRPAALAHPPGPVRTVTYVFVVGRRRTALRVLAQMAAHRDVPGGRGPTLLPFRSGEGSLVEVLGELAQGFEHPLGAGVDELLDREAPGAHSQRRHTEFARGDAIPRRVADHHPGCAVHLVQRGPHEVGFGLAALDVVGAVQTSAIDLPSIRSRKWSTCLDSPELACRVPNSAIGADLRL